MVDAAPSVAPTPSVLLKSIGPRLLRDTLGPPATFYAAWKISGNVFIGIAVATAFSAAAYAYERRNGRPGLITRVVLLFVVVQAIIGVATDSATAYLVQPALLGVVNGLLWLGSVALGRPLAGIFAQEVFPVSEEVRVSGHYRAVFRHISLWLGIFFVTFAAAQLAVLLAVGIGAFLATRVADAVGTLLIVAWCVRYISHHLGEHLSFAG